MTSFDNLLVHGKSTLDGYCSLTNNLNPTVQKMFSSFTSRTSLLRSIDFSKDTDRIKIHERCIMTLSLSNIVTFIENSLYACSI